MPLAGPSLIFLAQVQGYNDILAHASSHRIQRQHHKDSLKNKRLAYCCFSPRCHWGRRQLVVSQKRGLALPHRPGCRPGWGGLPGWGLPRWHAIAEPRVREALLFCLSARTEGDKEVLLVCPLAWPTQMEAKEVCSEEQRILTGWVLFLFRYIQKDTEQTKSIQFPKCLAEKSPSDTSKKRTFLSQNKSWLSVTVTENLYHMMMSMLEIKRRKGKWHQASSSFLSG